MLNEMKVALIVADPAEYEPCEKRCLALGAKLGTELGNKTATLTKILDDKIIYRNCIDDSIVSKVTEFASKHKFPIGYSNQYAIHSTSDVFSKAFSLDQTILCSIKEEIDVSKLFGLTKLYLWADR